jgi:hypothetical protein
MLPSTLSLHSEHPQDGYWQPVDEGAVEQPTRFVGKSVRHYLMSPRLNNALHMPVQQT